MAYTHFVTRIALNFRSTNLSKITSLVLRRTCILVNYDGHDKVCTTQYLYILYWKDTLSISHIFCSIYNNWFFAFFIVAQNSFELVDQLKYEMYNTFNIVLFINEIISLVPISSYKSWFFFSVTYILTTFYWKRLAFWRNSQTNKFKFFIILFFVRYVCSLPI